MQANQESHQQWQYLIQDQQASDLSIRNGAVKGQGTVLYPDPMELRGQIPRLLARVEYSSLITL